MPDTDVKKTTDLFVEIDQLKKRVDEADLPSDLREQALAMIGRVRRMARHGAYSSEYERTAFYVNWIVNLPWNKRSKDILDLKHAVEVLNTHHYGLQEVKNRVLEYMAILQLKQQRGVKEEVGKLKLVRAPILCFVGLVGTGKTTIAYAIAEAMGREFVRVPFGGMGDPLDLRGQSRLRPDAEPGLIVKALRRAGTRNPVMLLDEIDRVTDEGRSSIMGVLVELLDPEQNMAYRDHFLDYPFDLSEVLFIATCNNTASIATAVLDRLEPIRMPSYTDQEKITIGKRYVFPRMLRESGLEKDSIIIDDDVWPQIVRPLGFDAGIRTLERTINGICRKVAKMIVQGEGRQFRITRDNVKQFLPGWQTQV